MLEGVCDAGPINRTLLCLNVSTIGRLRACFFFLWVLNNVIFSTCHQRLLIFHVGNLLDTIASVLLFLTDHMFMC